MRQDRIVTAAELELMSPEERLQLLKERTITDLSELEPEVRERIRAQALEHYRRWHAARHGNSA